MLTPTHTQPAPTASTHLRQTFESDYPKLVRVFSDLLSQLEVLAVTDSRQSLYAQPAPAHDKSHER